MTTNKSAVKPIVFEKVEYPIVFNPDTVDFSTTLPSGKVVRSASYNSLKTKLKKEVVVDNALSWMQTAPEIIYFNIQDNFRFTSPNIKLVRFDKNDIELFNKPNPQNRNNWGYTNQYGQRIAGIADRLQELIEEKSSEIFIVPSPTNPNSNFRIGFAYHNEENWRILIRFSSMNPSSGLLLEKISGRQLNHLEKVFENSNPRADLLKMILWD